MPNRLIALVFAALVGLSAFAQTPGAAPVQPKAAKAANAAKAPADPRDAIAKKIDGLKAEDVRMSPITGLYEIARGSQIGYVSGDARYVILGDLIDIDADANLSENRRRAIRNRLLDTVPESEMLVYGSKTAPYTLTIFTDIDCGYCRKLHSQMADYNRLGIRVRYLFFPRSGPNTESWHKAESVWCASNRNDALTRAKKGEDVKSSKCATQIVSRDFELGQKLGVDGTPAIFLPTGEMLPGYTPPTELVHYLKTGKMP
jgi:thiol:disulfide interchange protein DsbC